MGWRVAGILAGAVVLLGGCAGGEEQGRANVGMLDNTFTREVTRVPVGQPVRFVNDGRSDHNAFAVDGAWATDEVVAPGGADSVTVSEPGVYRFYCSFHGTADGDEGMVATLVVGDVAYSPADAEDRPANAVAEASGTTLRVPGDHPTIQAAVDAAAPGDLVLISPGTYQEGVSVRTPSVTLRGTDRNEVVIDAGFAHPHAISVTADGVAVENLTVRNGRLNGVFFTGVTGYRVSYVTAYNNADYGIYAFDATDGLFEHAYASGSPDAGFYIGQCYPCRAVIADVTAEYNGLGYSGTNAGGELYIIRSIFRRNLGGVVPNTLDSELLPPQRDTTIVGNVVADNGNRAVPIKPIAWPVLGHGIIVAGGIGNTVERNLVVDNPRVGILVTPNLSDHLWLAEANTVRDNVVRGSGRADLALAGPAGQDNCFAGNLFATSTPPGLEVIAGCDGPRLPAGLDLSATALSLGVIATTPHPASEQDVAAGPVPPPQPQLPADAPVRPAVNVFNDYDLDIAMVALPHAAEAAATTEEREVMVFGLPLVAAGFWELLFGFYGYLLPFVLYAAWTTLALWDLARRDDLGRAAVLGWVAAILVVPFLGVVAYHVVGGSRIPAWLRAAIVGGGIAAYLLILGLAAVAGGVL